MKSRKNIKSKKYKTIKKYKQHIGGMNMGYQSKGYNANSNNNNNKELLKYLITVLNDCVSSLNHISSLSYDQIPRRRQILRLYKNNKSRLYKLPKDVAKVIEQESNLTNEEYYENILNVLPFETMLKNIKYRKNIIDSVRNLSPDILNKLLINQIIDINNWEHNNANMDKLKSLEKNDNNTIKSWNLSECGLHTLPELFGALYITEDLLLYGNTLISLPSSFGYINVGGDLNLYNNSLNSLPDSFG